MKIINTPVFSNVCIATSPSYTKNKFEESKNSYPFGFVEEVGRATILPVKYLFEPEELNKLAYTAYVTWQYINAMLGRSTPHWPFYSARDSKSVNDIDVIDDIADFLEKIDEIEQSKLARIHADSIKKHSKKELEHFLFGSNHSVDDCQMINDLFFMNMPWYSLQIGIEKRMDKKIADYLFNNLEFVFVENEIWGEWIRPYVDSMTNYKERVEFKLSKWEYGLFPYSLFLNVEERVYQEYYQGFERSLGDKTILISKYLTSNGLRIAAQFSDGQQLIDLSTGEIISQESNLLRSKNQKLWSLNDVPKWKLIDGLNPSLEFLV